MVGGVQKECTDKYIGNFIYICNVFISLKMEEEKEDVAKGERRWVLRVERWGRRTERRRRN